MTDLTELKDSMTFKKREQVKDSFSLRGYQGRSIGIGSLATPKQVGKALQFTINVNTDKMKDIAFNPIQSGYRSKRMQEAIRKGMVGTRSIHDV